MKIYTVGGAVRDMILGLPVRDRDYIVVGTTIDVMLLLGFQPVGKDFPVFLHPQTKEEYALARTERKTGPGYKGFVFHAEPDVTLEEDLARRDLTMNAMALSKDGELIDPFGGQEDLKNRVFRHVSPAFAEDPVRILRLARFAARFPDFTIAPETMDLMKKMVESGEVDALVPERIWQELSQGLMEKQPSRMFMVMRECGALKRILPELNALWGVPQPEQWHPEIDTGVHTMLALDYSAKQGYPLQVRFAVLLHDLGKGTTPSHQWPHHRAHEERGVPLAEAVCRRLRVSNMYRDIAIMTTREHGNIRRSRELRSRTLVMLLERCDAFRRPERFMNVIDATECDLRGRKSETVSKENIEFPQREFWQRVLDAARSVDAAAIAQSMEGEMDEIPRMLHRARVDAVSDMVIATYITPGASDEAQKDEALAQQEPQPSVSATQSN
ncbi:multifunctional CCA addition/repair protein [Oxalobacter vibrioformis]|uniref:Multifunctional CCA protein n=1 Tax=Oxalobacter vibrioformis TaxID=933080 RepID=A0A9E9P2D1_9BURK|nr:multifunctional CCA addition/repair protein [Oxalobacter vibrioformis]WAW09090.1 multifunctional CCA addition/repair protein [Oxalobacter vibrioformis]